MYKELEKYNTGVKTPQIHEFVNLPGQSVTVEVTRYSAKLGDLIEDFIDHKNKPWYKQNYYHKHLTKIYKDWLNEVSIQKYF